MSTATGFEQFLLDSPDQNSDDDSAAIVGRDTDARYCACGCGELLSPTAKWKYKRGHKLNAVSQGIEPDPDRPESGDVKSASYSGVRITKKMKDDIQGQLSLLMGMTTMAWAMRDPICAMAVNDNMEQITEKMVPIICRSPKVVKWMTKGTGLMDWIALGMALQPVAKVVLAHHVFHSIGTEIQTFDPQQQSSMYPVG